MYYYDPNGKSPRRWAAIAAAAYVLLIAASFAAGIEVCKEFAADILLVP